MAYKKGLNWYISKELKKVGRKLEKYINKRGTPHVQIRVKQAVLYISRPYYADFQDKGVKGVRGGRSIGNKYRYKDKMPPASAFERYTTNPTEQIRISNAIYNKGLKPKKYISKSIGHFAPQISKAIQKGTREYYSNEITNSNGSKL